MTRTKDWYDENFMYLNHKVTNLAGYRIGYVPLSNLLSEIPKDISIEELESILTSDGLSIREDVYEDNSVEICIKIK